jgi:hypothetical protein
VGVYYEYKINPQKAVRHRFSRSSFYQSALIKKKYFHLGMKVWREHWCVFAFWVFPAYLLWRLPDVSRPLLVTFYEGIKSDQQRSRNVGKTPQEVLGEHSKSKNTCIVMSRESFNQKENIVFWKRKEKEY